MSQPTPPNTSYEGPFSLAMGQFGPALGDVWRQKWMLLKFGFILLVVSVFVEIVAIGLSPNATFQDYLNDVQSELLDGMDVDIDLSADTDSGDSVSDIMNDIAKDLDEAEPIEGGDDFSQALEEAMDENNRIGPDPIDAPIYGVVTFIGGIALYYIQYIIVIFASAQMVAHGRSVGLGETIEAVRAAPQRFYIATILKALWIMGPALLALIPIMLATGVAGALGEAPVFKGIATLLSIVGGVAVFVWMMRRIMSYMFIEFYALFEGMGFKQAKETSSAIMYGKRNGLFWAWVIVALAFSLGLGMVMGLGAFILIIPTIFLGMVAKWTAMVIGGAILIAFMALIQLLPFYFYMNWLYRIWQQLLLQKNL